MAEVLKVEGLKKTYRKGFIPKEHEVLRGVDFHVEPGKITGFLGGNGAGKTTTIKCITGLAFPTAGRISYFGNPTLDSNIKSRIGFLPERPYFYDYLTGTEFLKFYGQLSTGLKKGPLLERIYKLLKQVDLFEARDKALQTYSKGMLQKIGLAQALIHDPELVILDEPMAGLDPDGRFYLSELIKDTASRGKSVFFSSHLLHDVQKLCDNLVILKGGKVIFDGELSGFIKGISNEKEVVYLENGNRVVKKFKGEEVNQEVGKILSAGGSLVAVRDCNHSLEEVFVETVLNIKRRGDEAGLDN